MAQLVIVMVGLPARGKSYIARKLSIYLNWLGTPCRVFNVGAYRRELCGVQKTADFFSPHNIQANEERMRAAQRAMDDMLDWLCSGKEAFGQKVAIYDATNSTKARRDWIKENLLKKSINYLFLESICDEEKVSQ